MRVILYYYHLPYCSSLIGEMFHLAVELYYCLPKKNVINFISF